MDKDINDVVRGREFSQVVERLDDIANKVMELAIGLGGIKEQLRAITDRDSDHRAQLAPIIAWVQNHMTGGLTARINQLEMHLAARDLQLSRQAEETGVQLKNITMSISAFQEADKAEKIRVAYRNKVRGWAIAIVIPLWGVFGATVSDAILTALRLK